MYVRSSLIHMYCMHVRAKFVNMHVRAKFVNKHVLYVRARVRRSAGGTACRKYCYRAVRARERRSGYWQENTSYERIDSYRAVRARKGLSNRKTRVTCTSGLS